MQNFVIANLGEATQIDTSLKICTLSCFTSFAMTKLFYLILKNNLPRERLMNYLGVILKGVGAVGSGEGISL